MRVSGELELDARPLREGPGVWLVGKQHGRRSLGSVPQRRGEVESTRPGIIDPAKPQLVSVAAERDPAIAQDLDAFLFERSLDRIGARPEIVVAEDGIGPEGSLHGR